MKFVDYKCKDCESITEVVVTGDNNTVIKCSKCGSKNMVRVFSPVGFKASGGSGQEGEEDYSDSSSSSSACSSCMGGDCSTCFGSK
ncbi:MAG: zinc ribbon domain-containing protein [Actinomycetota bacterium]|nr:zinc ribbon domain-containing protein [Actinomycetota bacterium]